MAHTCPECGLTCHCNGDIDDLLFDEETFCLHCDRDYDYGEDDEDDDGPVTLFEEPDYDLEKKNAQ